VITLSLLHPLNKKPVQHWTFEEGSVIRIGRSTENDVVLYSAVVSRHHVELRKSDVGWEIFNLGTNGTYLEGKRVAQAPAKDGIVIRLARSGPNIQINIGAEGRDTVKALMRLRENSAAKLPEPPRPDDFEKKTEVHPLDNDPITPEIDDDTPTSGNSAQPH